MLATDEKDASPFRPEQPLVAIGSQKIDRRVCQIEPEHAKPLNGVEKTMRAGRVGDLHERIQVVPPAAGISDPAHGDEPGSRVAGRGNASEIDATFVYRHAPALDAARGEVHPGIKVR